ncbi:MAG: hypothetical protein ABI026_01075, partial [Gemmatimonadaceae bacterium]
GRGLFILDDATALQQLNTALTTDATLFDVRPAIHWSMWNNDANMGQKRWVGENPPDGALITYYLKDQPKGEVDVTITGSDGKVIRRLKRVSDEAGVNRIAWDLREEAPFQAPAAPSAARAESPFGAQPPDTSLAAVRARRRAATGGQAGGGEEGFFSRAVAPSVLPGTYTVTVTVDGKQYAKPLTVEVDPRADITPAQLIAQHSAGVEMRELTSRVNRIVASANDILGQLATLQTQLRRSGPRVTAESASSSTPGAGSTTAVASSSAVLTEIGTTISTLKQFRDSVLTRPLPGLGYRQYPRLREEITTVSGMISRPISPPTSGEMLRMGELKTETDGAQARLDGIIQNNVLRINQMLTDTPHIVVSRR